MGNKPMGKRKHAHNRQTQSQNKKHRLTVIKPAQSSNPTLGVLAASTANPRKEGPYSNSDKILLLGEGNFSFALALATSIGGGKISATSYDPYEEVLSKYPEGRRIIQCLKECGAKVHHGVDAGSLHHHEDDDESKISHERHGLCCEKFDHIVFNFPHVGGSLASDVEENTQVLSSMFSSARRLLNPVSHRYPKGGQVHVTLRKTSFYESWNIEELAHSEGFMLIRMEDFEAEAFERLGYSPRRTNPATREAPSVDQASRYVFSYDEDIKRAAKIKVPKEKEKEKVASEPIEETVETININNTKGSIRKKSILQNASVVAKAPLVARISKKIRKIGKNKQTRPDMTTAEAHARALLQSSVETKVSGLGKKAKVKHDDKKIRTDALPTPKPEVKIPASFYKSAKSVKPSKKSGFSVTRI